MPIESLPCHGIPLCACEGQCVEKCSSLKEKVEVAMLDPAATLPLPFTVDPSSPCAKTQESVLKARLSNSYFDRSEWEDQSWTR